MKIFPKESDKHANKYIQGPFLPLFTTETYGNWNLQKTNKICQYALTSKKHLKRQCKHTCIDLERFILPGEIGRSQRIYIG